MVRQPWPASCLLPKLSVLRELDEMLAKEIKERLHLLFVALLPHLLSLCVPLAYVALYVLDSDPDGKKLSLADFSGANRPRTLATWVEEQLGPDFAPSVTAPPDILVAWSKTYVALHR